MDRGPLILLGAALLIVLWEAFRGWQLGVVRQAIRCGALVAAYAAGHFGGRLIAPFLRPIGYPDFILAAMGGACLGLLTYFAINLLGRILFRKTSEQELGLVWFFYGSTGALLGAVFGLFFVFLAAVGAHFLGTLAEITAPHPTSSAKSPERRPSLLAASPALPPPRPYNPVVSGLIDIRHTLETGMPGEVLATVDPIPKKTYSTLEKIWNVSTRPQAVSRFLAFPGAKPLAEHPGILALRDDPDIALALREHHYLGLLKNRRIVKLVNDPKIAQLLKNFDLDKALDYANRPEGTP